MIKTAIRTLPARLIVPALLLLLAACSGNPPRTTAPQPIIHDSVHLGPQLTATANNVLIRAIGLVGTPYKWGGNTPQSGFDCSGLVVYVYRKAAHVELPRTSRAMSKLDAPKIRNVHDLASGDLLFFHTDGGHRISHVAIYVGNGRFVQAPNSGGTVELSSLSNPYWSRHFAFARRVLE